MMARRGARRVLVHQPGYADIGDAENLGLLEQFLACGIRVRHHQTVFRIGMMQADQVRSRRSIRQAFVLRLDDLRADRSGRCSSLQTCGWYCRT